MNIIYYKISVFVVNLRYITNCYFSSNIDTNLVIIFTQPQNPLKLHKSPLKVTKEIIVLQNCNVTKIFGKRQFRAPQKLSAVSD